MVFSRICLALLLISCLLLLGCSTAVSPLPTRAATAQTLDLPVTRPATTADPGLTPFATDTAVPQPPAPTRTTLPNTPPPTISPTPTPTLYPDAWISGIIWNESRDGPTIYVGNSSVGIYHGRITYEPLNEIVAAKIAQYMHSTLVVFYGDYIPKDEDEGHIVVERVEQVNLPYTENTPFSESYTDPNYGFSFSYPDRWTLRVESDENFFSVNNRPSDITEFYGPGMEYIDPTALVVGFHIIDSSLEATIENFWESLEQAQSTIPDYSPEITVTQQVFNGLPVTQIEREYAVYSYYSDIFYYLAIDENTTLSISTSFEGRLVAERLLETLTLNES